MQDDGLAAEVKTLAREKGALILAHNYQIDEVQDVADFVGDSLELARTAAEAKADLILFCGVNFMAETAKILSPSATVLMPDPLAGCPMADMLSARQLERMKAEHPDAVVVTYVNSTAEVKALSDVCCTSGNAVKVVAGIPADQEVIFVPDASLGMFVESRLSRKMILFEGYCPTHHRITAEAVRAAREAHPEAKVLVHPECTPDVTALADEVASTSGIMRYAAEHPDKEYVIGTENGILHRLRRLFPDKVFHHVTNAAICPNMKLNTLEKLLWSLEDMEHEVTVPEETAAKARRALDRMLEYV